MTRAIKSALFSTEIINFAALIYSSAANMKFAEYKNLDLPKIADTVLEFWKKEEGAT